MIKVQITPSGNKFTAVCIVKGVTYQATSYRAVSALARILVAAGVPDTGLEVHSEGIPGYSTYRSFMALAFRPGTTMPRVHKPDAA